jgi:hypothetical protein
VRAVGLNAESDERSFLRCVYADRHGICKSSGISDDVVGGGEQH